ncbi:DNA polymerase III subunit alpha [Luteibaculum oceani]|uniref:DNA polymerase III subunit alpha n=2 Tax=Luteibaculum oceani TaxID=1294296 RepID=A0A5C6UYK5_9FLAO|nr:DNA polymerase III subunit alpha [Luteibaculum oceani]
MFLIYDTETTGKALSFQESYKNTDNWPRLVQLAWQLHNENGELVEVKNYIVKPDGFTIPFNAQQIHGISTERAERQGMPLEFVLDEFNKAVEKSEFSVGHNVEFDINVMLCEFFRLEKETKLGELKIADTMKDTDNYCQIPGGKGGKFKWPKLEELHHKLFGEGFDAAHNAAADVEATARCFLELLRRDDFPKPYLDLPTDFFENFKSKNPQPIKAIGLNIEPYLPDDVEFDDIEEESKSKGPSKTEIKENKALLSDVPFSHLHNHSQFSVLQSTTEIKALVDRAVQYKMPAVALSDHGNMMAGFQFVETINAKNKEIEKKIAEAAEAGEETDLKPLKAILGVELNLCKDHKNKEFKDNGYPTVLLAKNKNGFHNLAKLASLANTEGFYYLPRIDKKLLEQYKNDVILLSGGLNSEIPHLILNVGENQAEEAFCYYKDLFGDDFYVELLRHGQVEEDKANEVLLRFCEKHGVKYIAANNTYYLEKKNAEAHEILLCVKDGERMSTPVGKGRGFRFGLPNQEYYFKSPEEMKSIFIDLPEAISNTNEIVEKIEPYTLSRSVLLPKFAIPEEFIDPEDDKDGGNRGENAYLRHLTYEGAKKRYGEITDEIRERLDFELATIANTGYPGYFLIVQDFTNQARKMGVSVGPGRGSAAGSAVAYCIGITNVDPIKYDLLFERFLNPDRVSMPDIDIDFDDEGRGKIIDWVIDKYGANQVAQIITYGSMAAKSAIRDTARVLELPLPDADRIAKLIPDNCKLGFLLNAEEKALKEKIRSDDMERALQFRKLAEGKDLTAKTINQAKVLEGSVRNTGVHACGVIITPEDITNFVPVATAKDSDLRVTQFDNAVVEDAGLLKMDFLGLKTLTIINHAIDNVKERHGVEIVPDDIPLDDPKTYELFQRGETVAIFQYESPGMQKHLKALKPDQFADLIAMNALYRPGPLQYIPNFIARKHGKEEITYDLDAMEEFLKETYGITVYQEQVMLLSQKLAGFTKGEADTLRKAMGKKKKDVLDKMKPKFLEGCEKNGHARDICEKVWKDWEAFASYAFNKSHSTCYAYVAFHTAYLKAHYPAEFMASVLSNNMNDIKTVTFFMEECRRMKSPVLGPDVNESGYHFKVNDKGEIRFGMGAIKGVGGSAVNAIVEERLENGPYKDVFDFFKRINYKLINKKTLEGLVLAGALDGFSECHRSTYFHENNNGTNYLDTLVRFGQSYQESKDAPPDLFGNASEVSIQNPPIPEIEPWNELYRLNREKEVVGIYISGHPLDIYKHEIAFFKNTDIVELSAPENIRKSEIRIIGMITSVAEFRDKKGNPFGRFTLEDYSGAHEFLVFRDEYKKLRPELIPNTFVYARCIITTLRWRNDAKEVKIQKMAALENVLREETKEILIKTELSSINEEFIENIEGIVQDQKGNLNLKIKVFDPSSKIELEMMSKTIKIESNSEILDRLAQIDNISFQLN